jgi:DNA-binding NarL/FixJ family response regulator
MHEEQQYIVEALKSGADGYVTKNSACDELLVGIRRIATGEQFISAAASQGLIRQLCAKEEAPHLRLSYRERQVLDLLVAGHSVSDIARRLKISIKTASTHKKNMLEKMGFSSTADLIRYAVAHNLAS